MAFDGIVNKAIAFELQELKGAKVDKVSEPDKNTIYLGFYFRGSHYILNCCINPQNYRVNLTTHTNPSPMQAPTFCMLLRKHLLGLRLKNVITQDLERVIFLDFEGLDDIDDIICKRLVIELMGKHSNIILLDEDKVIIDSLRHTKNADDGYRNIIPHYKYVFPDSSKKSFLELNNFEDFKNSLCDCTISIENFSKIMSTQFNGISKSFIDFLLNYLDIKNIDNISMKNIFDYITLLINNINTSLVSFTEVKNPLTSKKDYFLINEESIAPFALNFFIDDFYYNKESSQNIKNTKDTLYRLLLQTLKKYKQRLFNIDEKLSECDDMEKYKVYGELITSNLYKFKNTEKTNEISIENYYDNNNLLTIPLDKKYSISDNAKRFFKKYHKLKNTLVIVGKQKEETINDLNYIESIFYELENCNSEEELFAIFEEMGESKIFQEKLSLKKKEKVKKSKFTNNKRVSFNPIKYTVDDYTILVGRNNKENDYLTLKYANKSDLWFHTKDIHGSHVILRNQNNSIPNDTILLECAKIAASHSKARSSSNVPVDYTFVKYVKKPNGAKPGMVIYTNETTLIVTPEQ